MSNIELLRWIYTSQLDRTLFHKASQFHKIN